MSINQTSFTKLFSVLTSILLVGCAVSEYPGQPGVRTNGYSKIDVENLDVDGLFVYEVSYDNTERGKGVGAIVTKLYPAAQTFTSNVRTNADGSVFRVKGAYSGAEVQMISIPSQGQIIMPPDSKIQMLIVYETSVDEVDDQNLTEQNLFKKTETPTRGFFEKNLFRLELIRAGRLLRNGNLAYEVNKLSLGAHDFEPSKPVMVQTNLFENGFRTNLSKEERVALRKFVEAKFPKGYKGPVKFHIKGKSDPMVLNLGLHSVKTAAAGGYNVVDNASPSLIQSTLKRFTY